MSADFLEETIGAAIADLRQKKRQIQAEHERLISLENDCVSMRLVVGGAFSSGKSAFINRMLRDAGQGEIAKVSAKPTTRCTTEYHYAPTLEFARLLPSGERKRILDRNTYLSDSCRENSEERFSVGLPCRFLRDYDCVLVDTPGFDSGEGGDRDTARCAIKEADALLWLVNVSDGTLTKAASKDDPPRSLDMLRESTLIAGGNVPIVFVMSFIDTKAPAEIEKVREEIIRVGQGKTDFCEPLRFLCAPIPYTSMVDDLKPRRRELLKNYLNRQDELLRDAVLKCREVLKEMVASKRKGMLTVVGKLEADWEKEKTRIENRLKEQVADSQKQLKKELASLRRNLKESLSSTIELHLLRRANELSPDGEYIESHTCKSCLIWDEYAAAFSRCPQFLDDEELVENASKVIATYAQLGSPKATYKKAIGLMLDSFEQNIWSVTDDSSFGNAKGNACEKMRDQLATQLRGSYDDLSAVFVECILDNVKRWVDVDYERTCKNEQKLVKLMNEVREV